MRVGSRSSLTGLVLDLGIRLNGINPSAPSEERRVVSPFAAFESDLSAPAFFTSADQRLGGGGVRVRSNNSEVTLRTSAFFSLNLATIDCRVFGKLRGEERLGHPLSQR